MIYLTKGQKLFSNEGMVVCDPTGYYEDGSSVACATFFAPDEPVYRYEAKFIAYGDQVYNIADQDKLLEEIKKIDPQSLLGKTNADVAIDNLVQDIKTVENPTPELTQDAVDINNAKVDNGNTTVDTNTDNGNTTTENPPANTNTTDTVTTYDENTGTTTTTTTTTDTTTSTTTPDTTPNITTDTVIPDTTTSPTTETIIPEVPVSDTVVDQPVSMLSGKRKRKLI